MNKKFVRKKVPILNFSFYNYQKKIEEEKTNYRISYTLPDIMLIPWIKLLKDNKLGHKAAKMPI